MHPPSLRSACSILLLVAAANSASAQGGGRDRDRAGGRVILFDDANFRGHAIVLYAGDRIDDFAQQPFDNGQASNDRISSVRIEGPLEIVLHADAHGGGDALRLRDSVANLSEVPGPSRRGNWNDTASSAYVARAITSRPPPSSGGGGRGEARGARVEFYADSNYRGSRLVLAAGDRVVNLADIRFEDGGAINDRISSIRVLGGATVTVYEDGDFHGASLLIDESVPNLAFRYDRPGGQSWNDVISSMTVARGHVSQSAEQIVLRSFRELLQRDPDPSSLARYADAIRHRGYTEAELRTEIRRSREYREREAEDVIRRAYRDILKREPDESGLSYYKRMMLEHAWTERDLRETLRRSEEARPKDKG